MDRSQYLAQALQSMSADPGVQTQPTVPAVTPEQVQTRKAWQAANPGQSYMANNLRQAGQNVMQAPGNVMANLSGLFRMGKP